MMTAVRRRGVPVAAALAVTAATLSSPADPAIDRAASADSAHDQNT